MAERSPEDSAAAAVAADFMPLARAAALLHERLFPGDHLKDAKTLDVLALALSQRIPLYVRDPESGALRVLADAEIATGRFTRGAMRLEFAAAAPLRFLLAPRGGLQAAIEAIASDPACPVLKMRQPAQRRAIMPGAG